MRVKIYYFIRPKKELVELLSAMDILSVETLSQGQLWESEEGGKSLWSPDDYIARAKLAFLINLQTEYSGVEGIESIFLKDKISLSLFDSYWSIELTQLTGAVEEIPEKVLSQSEVNFSGKPYVDEWLAKMIKA